MPAQSRDARPPNRGLSERLKRLHALAAHTKAQEQALKDNAPPLRSALPRLVELRLRDLRGATMTPAEQAELRQLERDDERDREDRLDDDWTR